MDDVPNRDEMNRKNQTIPLDNSAKIYPSVIDGISTLVFRLAVTLDFPVDSSALKRAAKRALERYPCFQVSLIRGFLWYYLEHTSSSPIVEEDGPYPCEQFVDTKKPGLLFRLRIKTNRIALDVSHILTDGTGAMEYFKTLLGCYFEEMYPDSTGELPSLWNGIKHPSSKGVPEEWEDSYKRFFKSGLPGPAPLKRAFQIPDPVNPEFAYRRTTLTFSAKGVKLTASKMNVSPTQLLSGVYMIALQEACLESRKSRNNRVSSIIRLEIPVNMRNHYPTPGLGNFSLYVLPEHNVRNAELNLEEMARLVQNSMEKQNTTEYLDRMLARNVKGERFIHFLPWFMKAPLLRMAYTKLGEGLLSGLLSNLGTVELPRHITQHVQHWDFIPAPSKAIKILASCITFGDELRLSFVNLTNSDSLIDRMREIFCLTLEPGVCISVDTPSDFTS